MHACAMELQGSVWGKTNKQTILSSKETTEFKLYFFSTLFNYLSSDTIIGKKIGRTHIGPVSCAQLNIRSAGTESVYREDSLPLSSVIVLQPPLLCEVQQYNH